MTVQRTSPAYSAKPWRLANERRYYSALRRLAELLALTVGKADPEYAECMADVERADDFHSLIRQRLHVSR